MFPQRFATTSETTNSGSHASAQTSWNVPLLPLTLSDLPHGNVEQREPVQQATSPQIRLVAKVQVDRPLPCLGAQPQAALFPLQVCDERDLRRVCGYRAEPFADDQLVPHQGQRQIRAHAQDGARRLVEFHERRRGEPAQRGERLREPGRLDEMGGGGIHVRLAEDASDPPHPTDGQRLTAAPQVLIPARVSSIPAP